MFRVKICGITTVEGALSVARADADAIGLNFFAKSPRYVSEDRARAIAEAIPAGVIKVGLFVNAPATDVCRTFDRLRLDLVQLHGDEPPEYLLDLGPHPVIRAFRLAGDGLGPVLEYLDECRRLGASPRYVLIDSFRKGQYGGTGEKADWTTAARYCEASGFPPLVLAGGLTSKNVAEAIRAVCPMAVDTASGVESSPGRKDTHLVAQFVQAARRAFQAISAAASEPPG
ncbi:MAG: phosphoribosylanthranilate isomerase [Rhodopirellula sp.]|nr:phosphoribosylanthranilate isomerase [Rhodopirellula sp.]